MALKNKYALHWYFALKKINTEFAFNKILAMLTDPACNKKLTLSSLLFEKNCN